jgi:hypothetical protein
MRRPFAAVSVLALALAAAPAIAHDADIATARQIAFPKLPDGRFVLAVDLHTHSVFSDGNVWPTIRVEEAKRDGLFAMATTEHLEYQPHAKDISHPDRNRSYEIAKDAAVVKPKATGVEARPLMVINGSEVTKVAMPPGHINAVFTTDDNALLPKGGLSVPDAVREQLKVANAQGAFVFWNHPYWYAQKPDGIAAMTPLHQELIKSKLLHGIEVANGADVSDEAFQMALDNNLTILGTSDIHGLIDWDYDLANGGHRTATLVLAASQTPDGLKAALKAGDTVAIYKDSLLGKPKNVEAVVRGTLKLEVGEPLPNTKVAPVKITNSSPIDYTLENIGKEGFYSEGHLITVKAGASFTLFATNVQDVTKLQFTFRALNTYIAPRQHLEFTLVTSGKAQ